MMQAKTSEMRLSLTLFFRHSDLTPGSSAATASSSVMTSTGRSSFCSTNRISFARERHRPFDGTRSTDGSRCVSTLKNV